MHHHADSELVLLFVMLVSGMFWFVIRAFWSLGVACVRSVRGMFPAEEHPVDWHGQAPPVCRSCGYDLRGSPEHCPECGTKLDPLDSTIVRYMLRLGNEPVGEVGQQAHFQVRPGRRGELRVH